MKNAIVIILIVLLLGLGVLAYVFWGDETENPEIVAKEQACIDSGGHVAEMMCCQSVDDFPNTCLIGACGCSPEESHQVKICECESGTCFDGESCVPEILSFSDCEKAGYEVMESYPRQCQTLDNRTFTEGEEACLLEEDGVMTMFDAMEIAVSSECGEQLTEPYYDNAVCDAGIGVWRFEMDLEQENCDPVCEVNIDERTANINLRCLEEESE